MRIHIPEIRREHDAVKIMSLVEVPGCSERLWYSVPHNYEKYLQRDRLDPFVVGLLLLGMKDGEDIYVDGVMSEKLFYNITSYYMRILRIQMPELHSVRIVPEQLVGGIPREKGGVATGFSGGVDSFCVLADHYWNPVPNCFRVTHLLFNNVGSHGRGGRTLFEERFSKVLPAAREMSLPIIKIDSNLSELLSGFDFVSTHVPRNVSAALTLQKLFGRFLYASAYRYEDCYVGRTHEMGRHDPVSVHLLSTEETECIATGSQYSRVQKTDRVSEISLTYRYLDVCVSSKRAGNCSECPKCGRTMLTLEMLGKLGRYGRVFDLRVWQENRVRFMGQALSSRDLFLKEIVKSAREYNWRFPALSRLYALCYLVAGILRLRRIAGRLRAAISTAKRRLTGTRVRG
jgi:hypothetical protein